MPGPPLWYCPVECRNRGPQPNVTGRPVRAASVSRTSASGASRMPVEVGLDGEVAVLGVEPLQQRRHRVGDGGDVVGEPVAGVDRERAVGEPRRRLLAAAVEHVARGLLGALDVRLVERVDADAPGRPPPWRTPTAAAALRAGASTVKPHRDAGVTRSNTTSGPTVASTQSGVLGSKLGESSDGTTTGRMPWPFLPVDSAISCSAQSPKPGYGDPASPMTTLSTPWAFAAPSSAPIRSAGLSGESASSAGRMRRGGVEQLGRRSLRPARSAPGRTR